MAAKRRKKRRSRKSFRATLVSLILLFAVYLTFCAFEMMNVDIGFYVDMDEYNLLGLFKSKQGMSAPLPVPEDGEVLFHFIDVGQGDSILVTSKDGNMLIDTSEQEAREDLDAYLKAAGVEKLKYLVLTHPDADHIGNADYIVENYDVENVVMTDHVATTKTYERLLDAIEERNVNVIVPKPGYEFSIGALKNTVIAPTEKYDDPNEMSIVIKAVYGSTSVMLTGDAETESESDICRYWEADALKCDILKVGHHGSSSSTTEDFLKAVSPKIAIISCGEGNKYGHPHSEITDRLAEANVKVYRTDVDGSIIFRTDGNELQLVGVKK